MVGRTCSQPAVSLAQLIPMTSTFVAERLLIGMRRLNVVNVERLRNRMAQLNPEFDENVSACIGEVFPGLPFSPTWLAQAWGLYVRYAELAQPEPAPNDSRFLSFILGLEASWLRRASFTEKTWQQAMEEGEKRTRQILMIVLIFHSEDT